MQSSIIPPKILTVVGMHRSGTSLTARYLSESGLFMGHDLLGKHWSNPAGHFEDREFFELHNGILKAHQVDYAVTGDIDWQLDEAIMNRAKALVEARSMFHQWGWKDPRTTLFIPFWKNIIPELHFVIVYRHYLPVVRSLISRDVLLHRSKTSRWQRMTNPRFTKQSLPELFEKYLRAWIWYNQEIITHILHEPGVGYTLVMYDDMARGDFRSLNNLQRAGFTLTPPFRFNTFPRRARSVQNIPNPENTALLSKAEEIDTVLKDTHRSYEIKAANRLERFRSIAPPLFERLVKEYGFELLEIKTNKLNNMDWSVHLIYFNADKNLRIVIRQEPYYTDYGFSFFVFDMEKDHHNILYHVEHHLQDIEYNFLSKAAEQIFSTDLTRDIISGKMREKLNFIPFQST